MAICGALHIVHWAHVLGTGGDQGSDVGGVDGDTAVKLSSGYDGVGTVHTTSYHPFALIDEGQCSAIPTPGKPIITSAVHFSTVCTERQRSAGMSWFVGHVRHTPGFEPGSLLFK